MAQKKDVQAYVEPNTVDVISAIGWLRGIATDNWQRKMSVTFNEPHRYGKEDQTFVLDKHSQLYVDTRNDMDILCCGGDDEPHISKCICYVGNILELKCWIEKVDERDPAEDDIKTLLASAQMWHNLAREYLKRGLDNDAQMCAEFSDARMDKAIELADSILKD